MTTNIPPTNMPFHPLVTRWFTSNMGDPTPIQSRVWPLIAGGRHVLVTAPTGSGKTLAAFLWALDRLIRRHWSSGQTRILYVSPLKALNNDIRRNLTRPLAEMRRCFMDSGEPFPDIRVATRSGDTPQSHRRQMIRRPPEILITTPESLHLLLSSNGGRTLLGGIRTVILDEIHAVAGNKRGSLLMSAVDRLVPLCGEFQRIALSASVRPVDRVAAFVAGFRTVGDPRDPDFHARTIHCCQHDDSPADTIAVEIPDALKDPDGDRRMWDDLAVGFREIVERHRATIIFTNARRLCERLTFLINADRPEPIAYAHHGSLSKTLRLEVEQRLKTGQLKAIVATSSLELGIDIGALDQVILVQSPSSVASALQRVGRSGHGVGRTSRATFVPIHAVDGITAAVLARAVLERDIDPIEPVDGPLDVLAQVLVAMSGVETWDLDRLYHAVRASWPFHRITRTIFDLVIDMLAGRYAATRIPALSPKIIVDRIDNTVTAARGALLSLYSAGGVIPDRGYFALRDEKGGARIGELDEEFVWEARKGQVFTLGSQNWRIQRITHNEVFVRPARPKTPVPPFWRADGFNRAFHLSEKIGRFLESAQATVDPDVHRETLCRQYHLDEDGARFVTAFLARQQRRTGCPLPHRHHVVVEIIPQTKGAAGAGQVVVHTFWGGAVNRPFALALTAGWQKHHGHAPAAFATNDAVHLVLPDEVAVDDDIIQLVPADQVDALVRDQLAGSGVFGARFRECAGRALLLPRRGFNRRMPLWLTRKHAQRLMDAVSRYDDFPILLEAWRSCLKDDFDMPALTMLLREIEAGLTTVSVVHSRTPSPMALSGAWRQVNQYMYEDDRQPGSLKSGLSGDLLKQVLFTPELRPSIDPAVIGHFIEKRQRLAPGYAPQTPVELLAWVRERVLIPAAEWRRLLDCPIPGEESSLADLLDDIAEKLVRLIPEETGDTNGYLVVAAEDAMAVRQALYPGRSQGRWLDIRGDGVQPIDGLARQTKRDIDPLGSSLLAQWLRFYGPLVPDRIQALLGLSPSFLTPLLETLIDARTLVSGRLTEGSHDTEVCDADNFEALLRMARRYRAAPITPRPVNDLAPLMARHQGVMRHPGDTTSLADCLDQLSCLTLPATLWETDILPARLDAYAPEALDRLMQAPAFIWVGAAGRQVAFCHEADLDLMVSDKQQGEQDDASKHVQSRGAAAVGLFPDRRGRYTLGDLLGDPPRPAHAVLALLWDGVWAGRITNDTMMALRQAPDRGGSTSDRSSADRWIGSGRLSGIRRQRRRSASAGLTGAAGNWRVIPDPAPPDGMMASEALVKDRVRLLLDRYGILFRSLLRRELAPFQWGAIFRTLRLMELAGEVIGGVFFEDLPGPQFVSPRMLGWLRESTAQDTPFWICAQDPASLCGLGIDALGGALPRRAPGTHLVYRGSRLLLVSRRKGRRLSFYDLPGNPDLADCLPLFVHLLGRRVDPAAGISIETINDAPAPQSPYLDLFRERFDTLVETRTVTLYLEPGA